MILSIVIVLSFAGCASSKSENTVHDYVGGMSSSNGDFDYGSANPGISADSSLNTNGNGESFSDKDSSDVEIDNYDERKIVYTVHTTLQTKDFEGAMALINENIDKNNGYVQNQQQENYSNITSPYSRRSVSMVVRVPSAKLESFLSGLKNDVLFTLSLSKDSKDYSSVYYDKESRVNTLRVQEERLLDLLSKADDLESMLKIEDRLSNIRYQIESLTKEMNFIDSNVDYATITIKMEEVVEYDKITKEPETFWERFGNAVSDSWEQFVDGCQDFLIWIVYALPALLIVATISLIVIVSVKKSKRKKLKKANHADQMKNSNK
jgi:hypothetical protein